MDPAKLTHLQEAISHSRFGAYLDSCLGDHDQAIRLYTWNIEASAALWGPVHALEIGLRNGIHKTLLSRFGRTDWWEDPRARLHPEMGNQIETAKKAAEKTARRKSRPVLPGDVVAASSFAFWVGLLAKRGGGLNYETLYWQPAVRKTFPHSQVSRGSLQRSFDQLRLLRNRIAHHEPIFGRHLKADHDSIIRLASYLSADVANYISQNTRVPQVLAKKQDCIQSGINSSF